MTLYDVVYTNSLGIRQLAVVSSLVIKETIALYSREGGVIFSIKQRT
jgi:hypothetical protein